MVRYKKLFKMNDIIFSKEKMIDSVTIIMNTYKENKTFLKQAIDSYLCQKDVNIQLIVSTIENDPSIFFIKENYDPTKIELCISTFKEHPGKGIKGIYYQLNKATSMIKNDWFCYASSNDFALQGKLKKEIKMCKQNNKFVCYSDYNVTDINLKTIKKHKFPSFNYNLLLKGNFINDCAMIRTDILKNFLPFDDTYYNCGYWNLWLRIYSKLGNVFIHNPNPGFLYRHEKTSTHILRNKNKNKQLMYQNEKLKMIKNHIIKTHLTTISTLSKK